MGDSITEVVEKIYNNEIVPKVIAAASNIAYEIIYAIQSNFESCVDAFYDHYDPSEYDRYYNTYLASSAAKDMSSVDLFSVSTSSIKKNTRIMITAGINIDHGRLGEPYQDKGGSKYVFTRTWTKGIHGRADLPVMSPSPKKMMDDWFKDFLKVGVKTIVDGVLKSSGF